LQTGKQMRVSPLLSKGRTTYQVKEIKEMPDLHIRLGQYCTICQYKHEEEYLVCDYCNEHKTWICLKDIFYNYGFSRRSYHIYSDCYFNLFSPRLVEEDTMCKAYQSIIQVIKDRTSDKSGNKTIDNHEAVRIAYIENIYMQKYLDKTIK
jgi:hypothetical protein